MSTVTPSSTSTSMSAVHVTAPSLQPNPRSTDFKYFRRQFDNYLLIIGAAELQKLPLLLNSLGVDGLNIYDGLDDPKNTYSDAIGRLSDYFDGKSSVLVRRKQFYEAKQLSYESVNEFAVRLRRLAKECEFAAACPELLRDIFVIGVKNGRLAEQLLALEATALTFDIALRKAEAFERATAGRNEMEKVSVIRQQVKEEGSCNLRKCYRCGSNNHLANSDSCKARNVECRMCHKVGHFRSQCRMNQRVPESSSRIHPRVGSHANSRASNSTNSRAASSSNSVKGCAANSMNSSRAANATKSRAANSVISSCANCLNFPCIDQPVSDNGEFSHRDSGAVSSIEEHAFAFNVCSTSCDEFKRRIVVNGQEIECLIDTGASVNVIPNIITDVEIVPTDVTVEAWGNFTLKVLGKTTLTVVYKDKSVAATFVVVDSHGSNIPLLSGSLCRHLGLLDELVSHAKPADFIAQYPQVFSGIGKLKDFKCTITCRPNAVPFSCAPRRLPLSLVPDVKKELDNLIENDIIMKVSEPSEWSSPIVAVRKKDQSLRICCDYRKLNDNINRQLFHIPTVEDLLGSITNAKVFSLLDCNKAYYQIEVSEDSRSLLTFGTPCGQYTFKRLPFGIKCAPEIFQKIMSELLADIPGVLVFIDDILVYGSSVEEQSNRLHRVLQRLQIKGITLNPQKCTFSVSELTFLGHKISERGIEPSLDKVKAISEIKVPETKEQLRSFLGLVTYVGHRFVPNFASYVKPLWKMVAKDRPSKPQWSDVALSNFEILKNKVADISSIAWYNPSVECLIQTDASGTGLGAVLLQEGQPVAYASRSLTHVEMRYSQLEREFLAVFFALKRFRQMILGNRIVIETDNRPIISFTRKPIDCLPLRIQRWLLRIQDFDLSFRHISGKENKIADGLSRNSLPSDVKSSAEYSVCFILQGSPMELKTIASHTVLDSELIAVYEAISSNWSSPFSKQLKPFYHFREQLSVKHSRDEQTFVIMKGERIIIPLALRKELLTLLHEGHIGMSKMKHLLRSFAYWPTALSDIENEVKHCDACTRFQNKTDKMPLKSVVEEATRPWETVSIDLTGPSELLQGKTLLTIIDHYTRFPEVVVLRDSSTRCIIESLRNIFARFGFPKHLISDNGTCFTSHEFEHFLESTRTVHRKSSVFFPQSNGLIERFHSTLKTRLRKLFHDNNLTLNTAIDRILYDIRSCPHEMTGQTPFYRMFGRSMRTKMSELMFSSATSSGRNVESEYVKRGNSRIVNYKPGDAVYVKKGFTESHFCHPAIVLKCVGRGAYKVKFYDDSVRVYNQRFMKRRFKKEVDSYDDLMIDSALNEVDHRSGASSDITSIPPVCEEPVIRRSTRMRTKPRKCEEFVFH